MLSWYTIRPPRGKHPCPAFANMLLNPSSPLFNFLIFSRLSPSASFMTFTLLTLQLSWAPVFTSSCKNWTVSTSPDYFQQKIFFWFELFCFSLPLSSPRKEIIISVGHWTFPQHCTHPLCPANWIWYSYPKQPLLVAASGNNKVLLGSPSTRKCHKATITCIAGWIIISVESDMFALSPASTNFKWILRLFSQGIT